MMEPKFVSCRHCGNLALLLHDADVPMICCGEEMTILRPNAADASREKHQPTARMQDGILHVCIGEVHHPMAAEHLIQWVYVQTAQGGLLRRLTPGAGVELTFPLGGDQPLAVYAYCNQHGLWRTKV